MQRRRDARDHGPEQFRASRRSTYSIAGHPKYTITRGTVTLDGQDVLAMKVDERARPGLFLAMQYPVEVAGCLRLELPPNCGYRDSRRVTENPHLGRRGQDGI